MTEEFVMAIMKDAFWTTLLVAGPILLLGLIAGLTVGIFQSVTQIQEMTLTFIPKIILVAVALALFSPWMLNQMLHFMQQIFAHIASIQ